MKNNNNLDLESYKPFIQDFHKYSGELFDFEQNIFPQKFKDPQDVMESKMRRSIKNEYDITEKHLKISEGQEADVSPERV